MSIEAVLLGSAQDGGVPHIGCSCPRCRAARSDPARRRLASALAIHDPGSGARALIDATPDIREQLERLDAFAPRDGRHPVDALLLTHAHMGHYAGLLHLGREGLGARDLAVHASPSMAAHLSSNAPWELMVRAGHLALRIVEPGVAFAPIPGVTAIPIPVPHRREYTDTHAFAIEGPERRLLYLPDIDSWEAWLPEGELLELIETFDVALIDGTFWDDGEIPGRDMSEIPHPRMRRSLELLGGGRLRRPRVLFVHLNHTNPAIDVRSPEHARVVDAGLEVAREGERFPL